MSEDNLTPVVPFNDLGRGAQIIRDSLDEVISRVVGSGWYVLGPEHDGFENELATYMGVAHAVGVGNGTDALQLALTGLGVGTGDTVLTAANAGGYTSTAARSIGAVPVFADVDATTMLMTTETVAAAVAALEIAPKVIVVTHLFGTAADIVPIVEWAHDRDIFVLEDCAQSLGAMVGDRRAGSIADVATTSFYPTKNLGALGDGGAILTSSDDLARTLRQLRQYGWSSKYQTTVQGGRNSRLDELQAAILRTKLTMLDGWNQRRREIHARYEAAVSSNARMVNVASPGYVGHLAVVEVQDREAAKSIFDKHGIRTDVHYPIPDHLQPIAAGSRVAMALPVTERAAEHIISVPLFPELNDDEIERTCVALSEL